LQLLAWRDADACVPASGWRRRRRRQPSWHEAPQGAAWPVVNLVAAITFPSPFSLKEIDLTWSTDFIFNEN